MAKVKICGIKRMEDTGFVNSCMPEYAGFVFAPGKRQVSQEQAKVLCTMLKAEIKTVGVFVNEDIGKIVAAVVLCGLDAVQIHGDECCDYVSVLRKELDLIKDGKVEIWKAIRVKDRDSLKSMGDYIADVFLLDTFVAGSFGGSGASFDWKLAKEAKKYGKVFLAGGLNMQNVTSAIRVAQPFGVDVSSGVETDGVKDERKIREFVCRVRSYD